MQVVPREERPVGKALVISAHILGSSNWDILLHEYSARGDSRVDGTPATACAQAR